MRDENRKSLLCFNIVSGLHDILVDGRIMNIILLEQNQFATRLQKKKNTAKHKAKRKRKFGLHTAK